MDTHLDLPAVVEAYERLENYLVEDFPEHADLGTCAIYFSSNGLFFPNTEEVARRVIWKEDRFEWTQLAPRHVSRRIFVRDVRKQWYVDGISRTRPDVDALETLLRALTEGLRVVCIGSSAGGFAAALLGCRLGASHVIGISAQFDLGVVLETPQDLAANPALAEYLGSGRDVSLSELIRTSAVPIYFLCAAGDRMDQAQLKAISSLTTIKPLAFKSRVHGVTCWSSSLPTLIGMGPDELDRLVRRFSDSIISPWRFSAAIDGWWKTAVRLVRRRQVAVSARSTVARLVARVRPRIS